MNGQEHYCSEHNSKFFRNEKNRDDGSLSVWYSHKLPDGSYCNEKNQNKTSPKEFEQSLVEKKHDSMLMCNAMNVAKDLAVSGRINVEDIREKYTELLNILETT